MNFYRARIGSVEIVSLQDSWVGRDPGDFFPGVTRNDWGAYEQFFNANGQVTINFGSWLIRSAGQTILVDTGLGERARGLALEQPASLPRVMQAAGVTTADLDLVIFTHLHWDHVGWNCVEAGGGVVPRFPKARHVVQRVEWDYWHGANRPPEGPDLPTVLDPLERAALVDLVEGEHAVTPEVVTLPTPGHTPGHVSFAIVSGGERAYILGDAAHHPVQVTRPEWGSAADIDPARARTTRRALFARVAQEQAVLLSGHFPFPGVGRIARRGDGLAFRPLSPDDERRA